MRAFGGRFKRPGGVAHFLEPAQAARLGLVAIDGEGVEIAPAGVGDVVATSPSDVPVHVS